MPASTDNPDDVSLMIRRPSAISFTTERRAEIEATTLRRNVSSVNKFSSSTGNSLSSHSTAIRLKQDASHRKGSPTEPSKLDLTSTRTGKAATSSNSPVLESAAPEDSDGKFHILLAATGSVATIKIPLIIGKLRQVYKDTAEIQLIVTSSAENFMTGFKLPSDVKVWRDGDEWDSRHSGGTESVLHVRLRRWADIMLIAPLSANTLAKIANGICNNLVTSVIRAWNPTTPILVAPAMNTHMYTNPMTKKHLVQLKEECPWFEVLKPVEKVLVCGDIGMGGMREWSDVVEILIQRLGRPGDEDEDDDDDDEDSESRIENHQDDGYDEEDDVEEEFDGNEEESQNSSLHLEQGAAEHSKSSIRAE